MTTPDDNMRDTLRETVAKNLASISMLHNAVKQLTLRIRQLEGRQQ